VVTDRRLLDEQIQRPSSGFMPRWARPWATPIARATMRKFIEEGKKIIISTVQKFPFVLDEIAGEGGKRFAIIIDEAHSSQGGQAPRRR
jgi:type I restriction enzyme R subunit